MKKSNPRLILLILLFLFCLIPAGCCGSKARLPFPESAFPAKDDNAIKTIKVPVIEIDDDNSDITGSGLMETTSKKSSETVYATVNVNIRSEHTIKKVNIIDVLKKGKSIQRTGVTGEWSRVLYKGRVCYIKTRYLSIEKPEPKGVTPVVPAVTLQKDFVSNLAISSDINQLVCVIGSEGSDCTVSFHRKDKDGIWQQIFTTNGDCGSKGITYSKKEGDKKTPAGLYSFTLAFGIKADPGAKLPYRKVTKYDYWVDDSKSPYYNTWVNQRSVLGTYNGEHLIDHAPQYNYVLNIDYNPDCIPGLGSAIFLHAYNGAGKTSGCIAISESYVKELIQKVDSSTKILIVPDSKNLANY